MSWRTQLYIYCCCIYFTSASYTMCVPFLPIYLLDLGASEDSIELWAAAVFSISFLVGGLVAPVWGRLADKKGQKAMAVRSAAMLCISYSLGGMVATPLQLFGMRFLQGFATGFLPSILSLVSSIAPKDRLGPSLGMLQSAQLIGTVSGPLLGGSLAHFFGPRASFFIASVALCMVLIVCIFMPSDKNEQNVKDAASSSILADIGFAFRDFKIRELLIIFFIFNTVMVAIQPVLSLYVAQLAGGFENNVELLSGIACSLPPFIGALTSPWWGSFGQSKGFFLAMSAALFGAGTFLFLQSFAGSVTALLILSAFMGLFIVGIVPSLNAALSVSTKPQFRGRGFGMMTMAGQFGAMTGPLISGAIAYLSSISLQFMLSGSCLVVIGIYSLRRHFQIIKGRRSANDS